MRSFISKIEHFYKSGETQFSPDLQELRIFSGSETTAQLITQIPEGNEPRFAVAEVY
jgi:hypothetical protein